jgi:hypothetical protein
MPMDFPDLRSLISAAEVHKFRKIKEGESEDDYRRALADHVQPIDYIESCEIRNKVGWDRFSQAQNQQMVLGKFPRL